MIKEWCGNNNVSIATLERECGIGNGVISAWKEGSIPTIASLSKIARYTNIEMTRLVVAAEEGCIKRLNEEE